MRSMLLKTLSTTTTLLVLGGCFEPPSNVTIDTANDDAEQPAEAGNEGEEADDGADSVSGPSPDDGPMDDGQDDAGTDGGDEGPGDTTDTPGSTESGDDDAPEEDDDDGQPGDTTDGPDTGEPEMVCGDGQTTGTEQCDAGPSNGTGGACKTDCTLNVCGDEYLGPNEVCDDGNLGVALGQCNPGCTGYVEQARMTITTDRYSANIGIAGADAACGSGWRAMLSDGSSRIASVTPNQGDGQADWVLRPYTRYVQMASGALIGITNAQGLLPGTLENFIWPDQTSWGTWTGMSTDWTSSMNCNGWSTSSADVSGLGGIPNHLTAYLNNGGISNCSHQRHLYCVEQLD